ncbi:hypothetical protein C7R92_28725 [Brevibacillus porteri]|uniref:YoaP-like domain-containing protein n=1 Tax=Brevibacillus porteri TaxID=2126350 RepID=A0ABX5FGY2_9BACL|nr:hypothetical protein C7R92_28725 [Brevibacillus porteri]
MGYKKKHKTPTIWTTFGVFYNGEFITHEILNSNKFDKLLTELLLDEKKERPEFSPVFQAIAWPSATH